MLTSLTGSSTDSSPTRLPVRQKGSTAVPKFPKLTLPPLPPITNPGIRRMALTHSSCHSGDKRRNRELITNADEAVLDYEKLEHVGDGLLTAAIVTLLHDKYPAFGPGPATYLRGHMVSNRALSQIAEQYEIPQMVIAEQASKYMLQGGEKTKGSLFEAYVAGVYYSFLHPREGELETREVPEGSKEGPSEGSSVIEREEETLEGAVEQDLKEHAPLPLSTERVDDESRSDPIMKPGEPSAPLESGPSSQSDDSSNLTNKAQPTSPVACDTSISPTPTKHALSSTQRTHGQAFDHICQWLWPLFHPIAIFLTTSLRSDPQLSSITISTAAGAGTEPQQPIFAQVPGGGGGIQHLVPEDWKREDILAVGAVGALNQFLGRTYGCGCLPTWLTRSKGQQIWKLTCIVKTPEGKEIKSEAKRLTKRKAMNVAAYHVWQQLKQFEEAEAARRAEEEGSSDDEDQDGDRIVAAAVALSHLRGLGSESRKVELGQEQSIPDEVKDTKGESEKKLDAEVEVKVEAEVEVEDQSGLGESRDEKVVDPVPEKGAEKPKDQELEQE